MSNITPMDEALPAQAIPHKKDTRKVCMSCLPQSFGNVSATMECEPFSSLFMTNKLLFDKVLCFQHLWQLYWSWFTSHPLMGGYVADRYWGNRKSIFVGGFINGAGAVHYVCMCIVGHRVLKLHQSYLWTGSSFFNFRKWIFQAKHLNHGWPVVS